MTKYIQEMKIDKKLNISQQKVCDGKMDIN